ncbi:radical SAM protein [Facklamia sp. P12950]|uniref:radical SAM protein n=1 Tax=unclassified Facklamia TaxID=2622293 RepID=UPI003D180326
MNQLYLKMVNFITNQLKDQKISIHHPAIKNDQKAFDSNKPLNVQESIINKKELKSKKGEETKEIVIINQNILDVDIESLINIIPAIKKDLSNAKTLKGITSSQSILDSSEEDLLKLRLHGLDQLYLLIETGSDQTLNFYNKHLTIHQEKIALKKLKKVGINYSIVTVIGAGGNGLSDRHAIETAKLINHVDAEELILLTIDAEDLSSLKEEEREGFVILTPRESLEEELMLLNHINTNIKINGNHSSNTISLSGKFPQDKEEIISQLEDKLYNWEEENKKSFRDFLKIF